MVGVARSPPPLVGCRPNEGTPGAVTHALSLGDTYSLGGALSVVMDRSREVGGVDECEACKSKVREGQKGILCDVCESWFHGECEGLKKKDFDYYSNNKNSKGCKEIVGGS